MVAESVIWPDVGACWPAAFAWPCPLPLPLLWAQAEEKPIAAMSSPTRSLVRIIDLSRGFTFPRHWPDPKRDEHTAPSGTRKGATSRKSNRGLLIALGPPVRYRRRVRNRRRDVPDNLGC